MLQIEFTLQHNLMKKIHTNLLSCEQIEILLIWCRYDIKCRLYCVYKLYLYSLLNIYT